MKKKVGYIDLEPKWEDITMQMLRIYRETKKPDVRADLEKEFMKMARASDMIRQAQKAGKKVLKVV